MSALLYVCSQIIMCLTVGSHRDGIVTGMLPCMGVLISGYCG